MKLGVALSILFLMARVASAEELQRKNAAQVTLRGQVVCSMCWTEADRTKVAYGTKDDLACAKRCDAKRVPAALAVTENGVTELYVLEAGKLPRKGPGWLDVIATEVEVTGSVTRGKGLPHLTVDALRSVPKRHPN